MTDTYRVSATHAISLEEGQIVEPGEEVSSGKFNPKSEYNSSLIDEGQLVKLSEPKKDQTRSKTNGNTEGGE
jgi:hypothetical protein